MPPDEIATFWEYMWTTRTGWQVAAAVVGIIWVGAWCIIGLLDRFGELTSGWRRRLTRLASDLRGVKGELDSGTDVARANLQELVDLKIGSAASFSRARTLLAKASLVDGGKELAVRKLAELVATTGDSVPCDNTYDYVDEVCGAVSRFVVVRR
jgi:hypothetical protein